MGKRDTEPPARARRSVRWAIDLVVLSVAWVGAFAVRFDGAIPPDRSDQLVVLLLPVVGLKLITLRITRSHRHSWQYFSLSDAVDLAAGALATTTVLASARVTASLTAGTISELLAIPYGVILADLVLTITGLVLVRGTRRLQSERSERHQHPGGTKRQRAILIGAGRAGVMIARDLRSRPDAGILPVGFLDDDPGKQGRVISGLDVLGTTDDLAEVAERRRAELAVIAIASATRDQIRQIVGKCEAAGIDTKIVPGLYEIVGGRVSISRLRPVQIEDLLGRDPIELDESSIADLLRDRRVLVTGAGGSIGSELARQALRYRPATLALLERSEHALWQIDRELRAAHNGDHKHPDIRTILADVTDSDRIAAVLNELKPEVILHAAAHKHVPMMEDHPREAIKNNVLGTKTLVDAAVAADVPTFVLISTDKAVNPSSVMGATKRLAERYVTEVAARDNRRYLAVRFGNVLGSAGSVVPIFRQQIADGGPVTVTHPDMTRYFMTIPEASQLVLQAAAIGKGAELFLLDMGEPVRIVDLANDLIRLSGLAPGTDIPITFTGIRPGEKLHEELRYDSEASAPTSHPKVMVHQGDELRWPDADREIAALLGDESDPPVEVRRRLQACFPGQWTDTSELRIAIDAPPTGPDDTDPVADDLAGRLA